MGWGGIAGHSLHPESEVAASSARSAPHLSLSTREPAGSGREGSECLTVARGCSPSAPAGWVVRSGAKEKGKWGPREASSSSREGGGCARGRGSSVPKAPWASPLRRRSGAHGERAVPARVPAPVLPPSLRPALRCAARVLRAARSQTQARQRGWHRWGSRPLAGAPRAGAGSATRWRRDTCEHR